MYGSLEVICGPMFASKTTETLKRILWAKNGKGRETFVFKPAFDNRYSETELVSHDGLRAPAESILSVIDREFPKNSLVLFDEIQFFTSPYFSGDVIHWIKNLLENDVDVIAAGLDMDWKGEPFFITGQLMGMADSVMKLTANCTICGRNATRSYKKTLSGDSVELGTSALYEARCTKHWLSES